MGSATERGETVRDRWIGVLAASLIALGVAGLLVTAVLSGIATTVSTSGAAPAAPSAGGANPGATSIGQNLDGFSSNGERIFYTGVGRNGPISVTWPYQSGFPGMMGNGMMGRIGCVMCHGADGRGRVMRMMGPVIVVPDIRYSTLTSPHQETTGTTPGWTDAQIADAVRRGADPNGTSLDPFMPKWEMNDTDMRDVLDHLKELSKR